MPVAPVQYTEMQGEPRILRQLSEEVFIKRARQAAQVKGAASRVQRSFNERFIHGDDGVAKSVAGRRQLLAQCEAERDRDILDQVVAQVPLSRYGKIQASVAT